MSPGVWHPAGVLAHPTRSSGGRPPLYPRRRTGYPLQPSGLAAAAASRNLCASASICGFLPAGYGVADSLFGFGLRRVLYGE